MSFHFTCQNCQRSLGPRYSMIWGVAMLFIVTGLAGPVEPLPEDQQDSSAAKDKATTSPAGVVQIKPLGDLLRTSKEFAWRFSLGKEAEADVSRQIEQSIAGTLGQDWRKAIELTKPIVLYAEPAPDPNQSTVVLLLPVKDSQAFQTMLVNLGVRAEKGKDDSYSFVLPGLGMPIHFRFANGHACFSLARPEPLAPGRLLKPEQLIDAREKSAIVAKVHIDRVPKGFKQVAVSALDERYKIAAQAVPSGLPENVAKSVTQFVARWQDGNRMIVTDGGKLTIRLDLSARTGVLSTELLLTSIKDSALAGSIAKLRPVPSVGAGLVNRKEIARLQLVTFLPQEQIDLFPAGARQDASEVLNSADPEHAKAIERIVAAFKEPFEAGLFDAAVTLHGPDKEEQFTVVFGLALKDGLAVEQLIRDLSKLKGLPENLGIRKLRLDAETIGKVKAHRLPLGPYLPVEVSQLFGKDDLMIAFRKDAVFAAFGAGARDRLRDALASRPKPVSPVTIHAEGDAKRIAEALSRSDQQNAGKIQELFAMLGNRLDLLHVTMEGGDNLHLRVAVNLFFAPSGDARPTPSKGKNR